MKLVLGMASALINMSKVESVGGCWRVGLGVDINVGAGFGSADGIIFGIDNGSMIGSSDLLFGGSNDGKPVGSLPDESLE